MLPAPTLDLDDDGLLAWLRCTEPAELERLWDAADRVRAETVGEEVHLRGLIELSNICVRGCGYCGISVHNRAIERYRMTIDEILDCARRARELGYGTVVLQAGEDPGLSGAFIAGLVREIKRERGSLAVTLSLGERSHDDLLLWREAGADRYLLRFESSNPWLYARVHPPHGWRPGQPLPEPVEPAAEVPRIGMLRALQDVGYQAGTGVLVGIPGQTWSDLVRDLRVFQQLDIEMIGVGPWIPHPATPLSREWFEHAAEPHEQVPNTVEVALRMVALARLLVPDANIPATTAIATLDKVRGREDALEAGANVVMPNLTPPRYRVLYEIYPDKACVDETAEQCHSCLNARIASVGRSIGSGPGHAPKPHRLCPSTSDKVSP